MRGAKSELNKIFNDYITSKRFFNVGRLILNDKILIVFKGIGCRESDN